MSYVLDAGRAGHDLDALAERHFDHAAIEHDDADRLGKSPGPVRLRAMSPRRRNTPPRTPTSRCACGGCCKPRLAAEHVTTVYETLERPLAPVLARMERRGISIDRQTLSRLSGEFAQRAARLEAEVRELAGDPRSIPAARSSSATSCSARWGCPAAPRPRPAQWSTGARVLDELAEQGHELPQQDSRLAAGHEAEVDLHGRAAGLHQSR